MKEIIPDLDKLFKDAIDQHHELPSDKVWDSIEHNLDKKSVVHITKRYYRLKIVALILLMLLGSITTYLIIKPGSKEPFVSKSNGSKKENDSNSILKNNNNSLSGIIKNKYPDLTKNNSLVNDKNTFGKDLINHNSKSNEISGFDNSKKSLNGMGELNNLKKSGIYNKSGKIQVISDQNIAKTYKENGLDLKFNQPAKKDENLKAKLISNYNKGDLGTRDEKGFAMAKSKMFSVINILSPYVDPYIQKDYFNNSLTTIKILNPVESLHELLNNNSVSKVITPKSKSKSKLSLTAFYSPDFSFSHLKDDKPHGPDGDRHHLKDNEKHSFSYTTGLTLGLNLNKHFSIQSGVSFSQNTIENDPKNITAERDQHGDVKYRFDASCGFGYFLPKNIPPPNVGDTLKGVSSRNNLQYVQIPVTIKYITQKGKLSFTTIGGVSLNTLITGTINTSVKNPANPNIKETQTISSVEGLKKYSLTGLFGAGLEYKVNKSISLSLIPTARIALTAINNGSSVKSYPNTLGMSSGFKINL